ncbi:unnamed protein product [Closterium sp. NIES-64]|nr:unnamed protein product [Closterium sp. NIES-64]
MCTSCVMAGTTLAVRRIARGANAHVSAGVRWRGRRGGLSDRRGGRPFTRIRFLSRQIARGGGSAREGRGGSGSAMMGSDPWRTDERHGAAGGHGYRQNTGAYRSPEEGYRHREDRSRGRGLEELFSGRQGDLDVDGEDEADTANHICGYIVMGEGEAACARQIRGRTVTGDATAACARQIRGCSMTGGAKAATTLQICGRCMRRGAEAATARQIRGSTGTVGAGAVRTRQIRGGIMAEEAEGICVHQILITLVMRDAEVAIARLTCNGTVERSGEARCARLTGTCNMKKAGKADTVRSIDNRAGAGGTAVGLARLAGVGNTMEDVPVREDGINAAAEREAAG